ncbi:MAG: flagellar M-ring protein FliF [Alphaproteobacteria bacterium]|nr:flagellar M-ring protein FliF [Alphaproteobacteria bacterium]
MNSLINALREMGPARLASMAGVAVFMLGFIIFLTIRLTDSQKTLLFGQLEAEDAQAMTARLSEMNVDFELGRNGTDIYVPGNKVSELRLALAETAGSKSKEGYSIFDNGDTLGATNFQQNVNLVRALEGELARTIRSIEGVKKARIHIVLSKREMFSKKTQHPTASVVVKMKGGQTLKPQQVIAIQHLVSGAVPKLEVNHVSVLDNRGKLLTKSNNVGTEAVEAAENEDRRVALEKRLQQSIQDLLERSIGAEKVRAEVNVDMDFSKVVTDKMTFDPDGQVVRSSITEEGAALSNEQNGNAVSVAQNLPDSGVGGSAGGTSTSNNSTRETVNYEISQTKTSTIRKEGVIKKISVAVLVDGNYAKDEEGKEVYQPRSEEEIKIIKNLVRSTIGFDQARGDTVEVANMRFIDDRAIEEDDSLVMGMTKDDIISITENLGMVVMVLVFAIFIIRPLVTRAFESLPVEDDLQMLVEEPPPPQITGPVEMEEEEFEADELIDIAKVEGRVKASSLRKIGEIVDNHPEEALNIIRTWLYQADD